jgi:Di-haem oxidoreductase, putative peroxidase
VRNGSGIPINTTKQLDVWVQGCQGTNNAPPCFMTSGVYNPAVHTDWSFTGEIRPMKLVFFDLARVTSATDDSVYSKPLTLSAGPDPSLYYNNKVMNFYGDSFHVTRPGYNYSWSYGPANANRMVVATPRINSELGKTYQPLQVNLGTFQTPTPPAFPQCQLASLPVGVPVAVWPASCNDISAAAITTATNNGQVGFMLLNGKRLGNSGAIELIPNAGIQFLQQTQVNGFGAAVAGEILWSAGTRGGVDGDKKLSCTTGSLATCYIGRFGWLGDRVSLEDQVANAAFVEMNMTTKAGYNQLYPHGNASPIRYNRPNCGPADQVCITSNGNSDLLEEDVERMADYARWLGIPTRSEFTVSLPDVVQGDILFRQLGCSTCHVVGKIPIADPNDTMLTKVYRDRLATQTAPPAIPFVSYLGTDLLMHDMGYLSQVGNTTNLIRDQVTGVVFPQFKNYVQNSHAPVERTSLQSLRDRLPAEYDRGDPPESSLRLSLARWAGLRCDRGGFSP